MRSSGPVCVSPSHWFICPADFSGPLSSMGVAAMSAWRVLFGARQEVEWLPSLRRTFATDLKFVCFFGKKGFWGKMSCFFSALVNDAYIESIFVYSLELTVD